MKQERRKYMRSQAVDLFELIKGFTTETNDNAMKAAIEMGNYVLELTNLDYLPTPESRWPAEEEIDATVNGYMSDMPCQTFPIFVYQQVDKALRFAIQWLQTSAGTRVSELEKCLGELSRCASMVLNIRGSENLDDRIMLMFSNANAEAKSLLSKTI